MLNQHIWLGIEINHSNKPSEKIKHGTKQENPSFINYVHRQTIPRWATHKFLTLSSKDSNFCSIKQKG